MNAEQSVIEYFKYKNAQNLNFLKFGYFKRIISYVLNCNSDYYIRKLFLTLVEKNYFIKHKNKKQSYLYKFNPVGRIVMKKPLPLDYFIVSWD
tara:strand:- start:2219 stop:2497 length:279 start_codon:yes stop_codon:yes gene_type:complete